MSDRQGVALRATSTAVWPPDDTEESVLGTNLHQATITNLRLGLNEVASALAPPNGEPPWQAYSQTTITGWRRRDGSRYTTLPDVYVYRQTMDIRRPSLQLEHDGPPLLAVEVLSPTTYRSDVDLDRGKPYSYALASVAEYLVLDPVGEFVPERLRGWRLRDGVYRPAPPDAEGRWRSEQISALIGLEGVQVAVYGPDGRRQLREGEINRTFARQAAEIERQIAEHARQTAENARQIAEIKRRTEEYARLAAEDNAHQAAEIKRQAEENARLAAEIAELRRRLAEGRAD